MKWSEAICTITVLRPSKWVWCSMIRRASDWRFMWTWTWTSIKWAWRTRTTKHNMMPTSVSSLKGLHGAHSSAPTGPESEQRLFHPWIFSQPSPKINSDLAAVEHSNPKNVDQPQNQFSQSWIWFCLERSFYDPLKYFVSKRYLLCRHILWYTLQKKKFLSRDFNFFSLFFRKNRNKKKKNS